MNEQTDNTKEGQRLYIVRLYKDFEFPSFSIDQNNQLKDLYYKALDEMQENYKSEEYFDLEILQTLPFTLRKQVEPETNKKKAGKLNFFIKEVAISDLEAKYGKLDYKANPEIYDRRTRSGGNGADSNSPYFLKEEIENYYSDRIKHYSNVFLNKAV